ncbi:TetR/AcrR family transcriptional regulator [Euzebya sp.]|uniref:TetR/AcrR family transcriptional regulator n=1 Tax=Euzebya sp. TaxID=1971409 RepID=UPI003515C522
MSSTERAGRDAPRRRDEVLAAATRVFHEKGYASASIQDVADELGILKGSLYYYIDSKEDLLFSIIDRVHRDTIARLEEWLAEEGDPLVQLRTYLEEQVRVYCRDAEEVGVFLNDFRHLSPDRRATILAERDRFDSAIRDLLRRGVAEGAVAADVDPKLTAMAIFGMMNWISTWWQPDGPSTPDEVAQQFADLVMGGLVGPAEGARRDLGRRGG